MPGMRQAGYSLPAGFRPGGASRTGLPVHKATVPCYRATQTRPSLYCGYIYQMRYYTYAFSVHK